VPPAGPAPRRSRPTWLPWAGAALGVLLVVVLLAWLAPGDQTAPTTAGSPADEPTTATGSATSSTPATPSARPSRAPGIVLAAGDYIGLTKDDAKHRLQDLGLKVDEQKVQNLQGETEGTVADIDPTGTVRKGDLVTLSVWDKPEVSAPEQKPKPAHGGKAKGHEKKGH
jgi:serine/threonine-protein kinase